MNASTNLGCLNSAFPDVCKVPTPAGPVPMPFPNLALSPSHIPSVYNVIIGGGLSENLLTQGTVSNGDEVGAATGLISSMVVGPDRQMLGSFKTLIGPVFATRLTTLTGQNGTVPNAVGVTVTPAQVRVYLVG